LEFTNKIANAFLNFVIYTSTCSSRVVNVCKKPTISALTRSSLAMRAASVIYLPARRRQPSIPRVWRNPAVHYEHFRLALKTHLFTGHGALAH